MRAEATCKFDESFLPGSHGLVDCCVDCNRNAFADLENTITLLFGDMVICQGSHSPVPAQTVRNVVSAGSVEV